MIRPNTLHITPEILSVISSIDEFKGAWSFFGQLAPEQLNSLKRVATIESIGSSTRIEGSKLSDTEVERLLSNLEIQQFDTRDQQEVAGYAHAMELIFQNYDNIRISENYIKQMHALLLQFSEKDTWHRGKYKTSPNHVEAFGSDGRRLGIVFETATPFQTPLRMRELIEWTSDALRTNKLHPLLIIGIFVVEFLAIHPFQDGNGRLSRILSTLLLLRSGYAYVPFSSLESIIEKNKKEYYLALRQTQKTLGSKKPDWQPWINYFLMALKKQKMRLEEKIAKEKLIYLNLKELSLEIMEMVKSRGRATVREIAASTQANRNTIKKHLEALVKNGHLQQNGMGKGTWYSMNIS